MMPQTKLKKSHISILQLVLKPISGFLGMAQELVDRRDIREVWETQEP